MPICENHCPHHQRRGASLLANLAMNGRVIGSIENPYLKIEHDQIVHRALSLVLFFIVRGERILRTVVRINDKSVIEYHSPVDISSKNERCDGTY